jgi:iron complex outermembrane receptor protein
VTDGHHGVPGIPTGTRVVLRPGGNPRVITDWIRQNTNTGTCAGATEATGCTPGSTQDKSIPTCRPTCTRPLEKKAVYWTPTGTSPTR